MEGKCNECGCTLYAEMEFDENLCIECQEELGILEPECYCCGVKLTHEEDEVGLGLCFACIDETNDI